MSEALKESLFHTEMIEELGRAVQQAHPPVDAERFVARVLDDTWDGLELKARMRHLTERLHEALDLPYPEALAVIEHVAPATRGFAVMSLHDYVECHGRGDPERSVAALGRLTRYGSAEFAIRPFLIDDPEGTLAAMMGFAHHEDWRVRRLASEGCRPRLPWAMALPEFKRDPAPLLPILEQLRDDPSEDVRRSVANNLNDISKDHPEVALDVAQRWLGRSLETDRLVKHALRGLLKAADSRALGLFGFADPAAVQVHGLTVEPAAVAIGGDVRLQFTVCVEADGPRMVRLEYLVGFVKKTAKVSPKVFQIAERHLEPGAHQLSRKHSFADRSIRSHYPGEHVITVRVNGVDKARAAVTLTP